MFIHDYLNVRLNSIIRLSAAEEAMHYNKHT